MNDQKKTKDKKFSKHLSIGSPSDFQHRWHVIYDSTHLRLTGVPPQWQKNIAQTESLFRYRSVNTLFTAKKDRRLQNICSDANRRSRTSSIVFNTPQFKTDVIVAELNETRVIAENPANLFDGVTIKTDFGPYTIFYGHKEGKKELFALKHLMVENSFQYNDLKNELEFLTKFSHQNIIQFVEAFTWDSFCLIVFNDYEDMSLHEIINNMYHVLIRSAKKNFSHDETAYITHSILCGLQFMHSKRYVNLDIKSDTILVSSEGIVCHFSHYLLHKIYFCGFVFNIYILFSRQTIVNHHTHALYAGLYLCIFSE
ncbi:hypothetical protein HZS_7028 [Henneguya salminicola]|uniref:non-specific serine/threonine protein kinase n=1 Tax=Henneguya salminicola TaxID=69463 RepID=A0A6G3MEA5_HENSL|nr:hypothetical protein HZS_7028 [Henneguya salminicola]